jgi:hypothetical protein
MSSVTSYTHTIHQPTSGTHTEKSHERTFSSAMSSVRSTGNPKVS